MYVSSSIVSNPSAPTCSHQSCGCGQTGQSEAAAASSKCWDWGLAGSGQAAVSNDEGQHRGCALPGWFRADAGTHMISDWVLACLGS